MIALNNNGISFIDANSTDYNVFSGESRYGSTLDQFSSSSLYVNGAAEISGVITSSSLEPATAVPWETDALPVIGSTILFAGGLWARNKFAKPLQPTFRTFQSTFEQFYNPYSVRVSTIFVF